MEKLLGLIKEYGRVSFRAGVMSGRADKTISGEHHTKAHDRYTKKELDLIDGIERHLGEYELVRKN